MKKGLLIFVLSLFVVSVKSQTIAEKQVANAVEKLRIAMLDGDRKGLENIAGNTLSYGHSSGKVEDKATFVQTIASGKSDFVTLEFSNQTISVTDKTALVRHQLNAKTNDGGIPGEVHLGILLVMQKQGKDWKLIGRQAFKLPQ